MRNHEIETWVLEIIDRVEQGEPVEDDMVELKSIWVPPNLKIARQLAGHANSSRGESILWIIGVDEKKGVVGVKHEELSNWWNAVRSCFDEAWARDLRPLNIPYNKGKTVTALFFETDRAPYVVHTNEDRISFETPWRDGNSTRSAKRRDLVRILSPIQKKPTIEVLDGELVLMKIDVPEGERGGYRLDMTLELYVSTFFDHTVAIPFHDCEVRLIPYGLDDVILLENIRLDPQRTRRLRADAGRIESELETASFTIESTFSEVLINTAGLMYLKGQYYVDKSVRQKYDQIEVKANLLPTHVERPIYVSAVMKRLRGEKKERGIAQWKVETKRSNT